MESPEKKIDIKIISLDEETLSRTKEILENICEKKNIDVEEEDKEEGIDLNDIIRRKKKEDFEENTKRIPEKKIKLVDVEVGKDILKKFDIAVKTNTPSTFIIIDKNSHYFTLKKLAKNNKNPIELYNFLSKKYCMTITKFLFLFYISNPKMSDKDIVDVFNVFTKITGDVYTVSSVKYYKERSDRSLKSFLEENVKRLNKLTKFYKQINNIEYSVPPSEIEKSFNITSSIMRLDVLYKNKKTSQELGDTIVNLITTSKDLIYIQLNNSGRKIYKIYNRYIDIIQIKQDTVKFIEDNTLYMRYKNNLFEFNLVGSYIEFKYTGDNIEEIKRNILYSIPDLTIEKTKKKEVRGFFEVEFENFDELKLYYLIHTDSVIDKFLFINEISAPRSLKENIKYYFKKCMNSSSKRDYSVYFYITKSRGKSYKIEFSSKIENKNSIEEFCLIFLKLITYYKKSIENIEEISANNLYPLIANPYTGVDGEGLGGKIIMEEMSTKGIRENKISILEKKEPDMFPKSKYVRICTCPKQPIIVETEDAKYWNEYEKDGKKKQVVVFPPPESNQVSEKHHFVCPSSEYNFVHFLQNKDPDSKYPITPCCSKTAHANSKRLYQDYDKIRKDYTGYFSKQDELKKNIGTHLKINKILGTNQVGSLPEYLDIFMKKLYPSKDIKFIRQGVMRNNYSSLIHCVLKSCDYLKTLPVKNKTIKKIHEILLELKMEYDKSEDLGKKQIIVNNLREIMTHKNKFREHEENIILVNIESCYQETYNLKKGTIQEIIEDPEENFDSKIFYKLLENLFSVNIFVFYDDNDETKLEKPNHDMYHIREVNVLLPSLFILKHGSGKDINTYEIIKIKDREEFHFPIEISAFMKNFIDKTSFYNLCSDTKLVKNTNTNINWNFILNNYEIQNQCINNHGKTFCLTIKIFNGKKISLFINETFPLNTSELLNYYKSTKKDCIKTLGKEYKEGSEGLWYKVNGSLSLFVPCEDIKSKNTLVCENYVIMKMEQKKDLKLKKLQISYKNSLVLQNIILWLWELDPGNDVDDWFDAYSDYIDNDTIEIILSNEPIKIPTVLETDIKTTVDGIKYFEEIIPSIFNNDTIYLYDDLYDNMKQFLKNYQYKNKGLDKNPDINSLNVYEKKNDFKSKDLTTLLIGEENLDTWLNSYYVKNKDISYICEDDKSINLPFFINKPIGIFM